MTSFSEAISSLTNPSPKILDPEDDINSETVAKVSSKVDANQPVYEISHLRSKTAPLLEDVDPKYAGRKISRRTLESTFQESPEDDNDEMFEDSSEAETEKGINTFLEQMRKQSSFRDNENDIEDSDVEDSDLEDQRGKYQKQSDLAEESVNEEDSIDSDEKVEDPHSNIAVENEIEKGKAIKSQQELWNKLCESRIKLQKLLILSNKLPQFDTWTNLKSKGGKDFMENQNKGYNSVKKLLNNLLTLQNELSENNPEINNLENEVSKMPSHQSDEEIPNDEEMEQSEMIVVSEKRTVKRKNKGNDFDEILAKRHKSLLPYRNSVVQKWDEKTRLSTGRMTQKSFMAFDNSALKQIEQILQDKNRLIKRTQLKRSLYRVLGKPEIEDSEESNRNDSSKQDLLLKDYDPEIFDDDDFYRQMLKDVIESKSVGIDPAVLRKQMEIQKIRNKMKRKVDTKASKGRKLRYDVHQKLLNFMAPQPTSTISDEARENLLKCLFRSSLKSA
ncbi:protein AATF-like isoform X2 [Uloborus diversus]|uniref:protein AATF-like isoform X2 n=1 Tax=Uloborus diversus TaxID=327109 RepID=UPI00240A6682|nr:protein AATF-like isoform X2 [Uloborus diversus]